MMNPAPAPFTPGFIKSIAKRPRIFALLILVAQWLDLKRQTTIKKDYVINDEYYKNDTYHSKCKRVFGVFSP